MAKPLTLDKKVKKLITEHGPLAAGFMAQAMLHYSQNVSAMPTDELQQQLGNLFDAASWQRLATAVNLELSK